MLPELKPIDIQYLSMERGLHRPILALDYTRANQTTALEALVNMHHKTQESIKAPITTTSI